MRKLYKIACVYLWWLGRRTPRHQPHKPNVTAGGPRSGRPCFVGVHEHAARVRWIIDIINNRRGQSDRPWRPRTLSSRASASTIPGEAPKPFLPLGHRTCALTCRVTPNPFDVKCIQRDREKGDKYCTPSGCPMTPCEGGVRRPTELGHAARPRSRAFIMAGYAPFQPPSCLSLHKYHAARTQMSSPNDHGKHPLRDVRGDWPASSIARCVSRATARGPRTARRRLSTSSSPAMRATTGPGGFWPTVGSSNWSAKPHRDSFFLKRRCLLL